MKLRLPLPLKAIILLCMANSNSSLATGSSDSLQPTQGQQTANTTTVIWKPAPIQSQNKDDEEAKGATEDAKLQTLAEESTVTETDLDEVKQATKGKQAEGKLTHGLVGAGHERLMRTWNGGGVQIVRQSDGKGGDKLILLIGKGEQVELKPDYDLYAFWNYPEFYIPAFFPDHLLNDGFAAHWVGSRHRLYIPECGICKADRGDTNQQQNQNTTQNNGQNTVSRSGSFPSFGAISFSAPSFGGYAPVLRPTAPAQAVVAVPAPAPADNDSTTTDDEEDNDSLLTEEDEENTTLADLSDGPQETLDIPETASLAADNQATPRTSYGLTVERAQAVVPIMGAPVTPVLSGAAGDVSTPYTSPAANATTITWTGGADGTGTDPNSDDNWSSSIPTSTLDQSTNSASALVFEKDAALTTDFATQLLNPNNTGDNNTGIIVRNGATVSMSTKEWLCMIQVAEGSALDFTMNSSSLKNPNDVEGVANVYVEGDLTIHNLGMCLRADWNAHDQHWLVGDQGRLTLDGNISLSGDNTWHIQKLSASEATDVMGTTLNILAITGNGNALTQLTTLRDGGRLDIQILDSNNLLLDSKVTLSASGITAYVMQDLVWKGEPEAAWTASGSFYNALDNTRADKLFAPNDKVTFNTAGANVTIDGTVTPDKVNIQAATTFTGGTVQAEEVNLSSALTLANGTLAASILNVTGTASLSGDDITTTNLNLGGNLTVNGAVTATNLNTNANSALSGSVTATTMNLGGGYTLTVDSNVTAGTIAVGANETGTLAATDAYSKTVNITLGANSTLVLGDNVSLDLNGKTLSRTSTSVVQIDGANAYLKRTDGDHSFQVSRRADLAEGVHSTIQDTNGSDWSMWNQSTVISNATLEFITNRHVQAQIVDCDVTTATSGGNRFLTTAKSFHNLTVAGDTALETDASVSGALVVNAGKNLSINANSAKLTINGTATIDGAIGATSGRTLAIGSTASMSVTGSMNIYGTLEIDMANRVSSGSTPIIDAENGTISFAGTVNDVEQVGTINLINYSALANGSYSLFRTNGATADTIVNLFGENYFTNTPQHTYSVRQNNGLVQLVVSAAAMDALTVDTDTTWAHDLNYATNRPVSVEDNTTLTIGKGTSAFDASTRISLGNITLGEGATLEIAAGMNIDGRTILTTDKPAVDSHITLGQGSTLKTDDGGWYFAGGLTVAGDATVIHNWAKGWAYGAIDGSGDTETDATHTLTFAPVNDDDDNRTQVIAFTANGNFGGTVELGAATSTGGHTGGVHYVLDAMDALHNAEVKLTENAELRFDIATANIRKLVGTGSLHANASSHSGNYTGATTLNVAEDSTFSGTIGSGVNVAMATGAELTLTNATVAGSASADTITLTGELTLDLTDATTGNAKLTANSFVTTGLASTSLTNLAALGDGSYSLIQGLTGEQTAAIVGQIGTLSGSIFKSYALTTDNGLGLDVASRNILLTWTGNYDSENRNDIAYGIYKYTTYDGNGNAIVSNEHILEYWWGTGHGAGELRDKDVYNLIGNGMQAPNADTRAATSLRLADDSNVTDRAIILTFSPVVFGSIIVEDGATGYSISQSNNRNFYIGSTLDDPMHSTINEDFSITMNTVHLRGKQNITVKQGKVFTLNTATVEGEVTLDGAGTLKDTGAFTVADGGTLNITAGTLEVGDISIYTNASMEMTAGRVNTSRLLIHNANGATKESVNITGGVLNATSNNKTGDNSSAIIVGHYQNGTQANTLDISGTGVLNAQNGAVVVSWNSPGALTIGGGTDREDGGELNADGLYFAHGRSQKAEVYLTSGGRLNIGATGIRAKKDNDVFQAGSATLGTLTETEWTMVPNLELAENATLTVDTGVRETHADGASTAKLVEGEAVAGAINMTGALTGTGSLTKTGAGTLKLAGTNTATGALTSSAGELVLSGDNTAWSSITTHQGATLTLQNGAVINLATLANTGHLAIANGLELSSALGGTASVAAGGTLTLANGGSVDLTAVAATGMVTVRQGAQLTLADDFDFAGTLSLDLQGIGTTSGALVDASAGTFAPAAINLANTGALGLGTYALIQTADAATAQSLTALVSGMADSGMHRFDATSAGDMLQVRVSYGATANATWYHDADIDTATPVTISGNGTVVQIAKGTSDFDRTTTVNLGDITLGNGATLQVNNGLNIAASTILATDKPTFASHVTLGEGTKLKTNDGSWYFAGGLTVTGNATVINQWNKGLVYGAINGSGTLSFTPDNSDPKKQIIAFVAEGDFGGTVKLNIPTHALGGGNGGTHYVIDHTNAFHNAKIQLADGAELRFDVATANIRQLAGNGSLTANNADYSGDYTGATTLNVAESSSFTGTIGGGINVAMATGTELTLANATIQGAVSVADMVNTGSLTLDYAGRDTGTYAFLSVAGTHDISTLTTLSVANYTNLQEGTYDLVQTGAAQAETLETMLGQLTNTSYKEFALVRTDGLLQLQVSNIGKVYTQDDTLTKNDQIPADVPVSIGGEGTTVTLTTGQNDSNDLAGTTFTYGDITVEGGSTLNIWLGHHIHNTILTTDKLIYGSRITLKDGAKLMTKDGSYYFSKEIVVEGNATINNQWDKGVAYSAINGVDAETDANHRLTFAPNMHNTSPKLTTFAGEGDFGGTVELRNRGNNNNNDRYVIDHSRAFQNAVLDLKANVKIGLNQETVNVRGLSGVSTATVYNAAVDDFLLDSDMTIANTHINGDLADTVLKLNITGDANGSYSGTIGTNVELNVLGNAKQTLDGATINGTVANAGTLTLRNMEGLDFSKLSNGGTLNFGGGNTTLGQDAAGLGGTLSVLAGVQVTIAAGLTHVESITNAGTLALGGAGQVDLNNLTNTGTLVIGNSQTLGTGLGGNVTVRGGGQLTLTAGSSLTGTLELDLTGTAAGGDYLVTLATGSNQVNNFTIKLSDTADGTYNLVRTDAANADTLKDMLCGTTISNHRVGALTTSDDGLQMNVHVVGNPVAGVLYKWNGSTNGTLMSGGSYIVAEYEDSTHTVYLSPADVLQDWDSTTSNSTGTQLGVTGSSVFGTDNTELGSLLFAADWQGSRNVTFNATALYLGGIVVQQGAEDYILSSLGSGAHNIYLGSTTETSHSYIHEDFTLSGGQVDSTVTLRGTQDFLIAEGKALTISTPVTNRGSLTLSGGGAMVVEGLLTNNGTITVDGNDQLTARGLFVSGSGSRFIMSGGGATLTSGTDTGLLQLHNGASVEVSGGLLTVNRLVIHDFAATSSTETMDISGGVVTVTSGNKQDNASAAALLGHWHNGSDIALNLSGEGVLNVLSGGLLVGWDSPATLNISGGEANLSSLSLNPKGNRANSVFLSGGRLNIGQNGVVNNASSTSFTVSGGTLGTITSTAWTFNHRITMDMPGEDAFVIDTQTRTAHADSASTQSTTGGTINMGGVISGTGNIEKTGLGKLVFSAQNTSTGNLAVTAGEVEFQNDGGNKWGEISVASGATLTLHSNSTKTGVANVTNNGTLQVGNSTVIGADEQLGGRGVVTVMDNGTLTSHNTEGLANATRITVNANGTLNLTDGFTQSADQRINNNGTINMDGIVALRSSANGLINNNGTISLAQGIRFDMEDWQAMLAPDNRLTKTFTFISGNGTVNGANGVSAENFYVGGSSLLSVTDYIRSISMDNLGRITVQYWSTGNTQEYTESTDVGEVILENNNPLDIVVAAGENVTVGSLTTEYTVNHDITQYNPGNYTFIKRGEGTLTVLSVPSDQIDTFTVTNGRVVFGEAPSEFTTQEVSAMAVHYTPVGDNEEPQTGTNYYVLDSTSNAFVPATDEQIANRDGLHTRSHGAVTVEKAVPAEDSGTKVVFDIGASRLTSMGGSVENVIYDYSTHRVTNVDQGSPAVMTDVELRLGNIINNDTSLSNVQFAGKSGLSGFVTIDQTGDNDKGANISVAPGATLTIGTATNSKLAFNFMPGTIVDHGADGTTTVWDHHLIDLGQDANLVNWDNQHVAFYYDGVLTKGIISTGNQSDSIDHLGVAHIDTDKAVELMWNGTGNAWNPVNPNSTAWTAGSVDADYDADGILRHTWDGGVSRFYALSNVHFNTLENGGNSNIQLGRDLTVMDFTIGVKVDDRRYGDSNWNGIVDNGEIWDMPTHYVGDDNLEHSVYNSTDYHFSNGNMRVLRDFYVRTDSNLSFEDGFNIEARHMYLYNANAEAVVNFGGTVRTGSLTIGQTGINTDCYGQYNFAQAVTVDYDLYIHVDSNKDVGADVDQVVFNNALTVGGNAMVSGIGSKMFKGRVTIGGDLTVSNCRFADDLDTNATSAFARFTDVLTVNGNVILSNGGTLWLRHTGSQINGVVQISNGTLYVNDGGKGVFGNGDRNFTFQLLGDRGSLSVAANTYIHIASLRSTDTYAVDGETYTRDHDFTIDGSSRNTDLYDMANVRNLNLNGGMVTMKADLNGKSNTEGIHGNLTVDSAATLVIEANNIFHHSDAEEHMHGGHTLTVRGTVTTAAGTTQTMTHGSRLVLDGGTIVAPRTESAAKALFLAEGDMVIDFAGNSTFGANLTVQEGTVEADAGHGIAEHPHTLTLTDTAAGHDSLLYLNGTITVQGNAEIHLTKGSHVYLNDKASSLSGTVIINSTPDDELNFLNSALTVTQEGQVTNARIAVGTGATLNVIAEVPVSLNALHLEDRATIALAALTGTKDLDASLSCIKVTDTVTTAGDITNLNLYFQDELKTMQTYAIMTLTKEELPEADKLTRGLADLINIYSPVWDADKEEYVDTPLARDQYDLLVSRDGRTLYLTTFFGMIWNGDASGNGTWDIEDHNRRWTKGDFVDGSTAIFRDLHREGPSTIQNAQVTLQGDISVDGIYVTAQETNYTFTANGTTLSGVAGADPALVKNGEAALTLDSFSNEQFGTIDINRGTLVLSDSTIDYTGTLIIAPGSTETVDGLETAIPGGTLEIRGASTLSERPYVGVGADKTLSETATGSIGTLDGAAGSVATLKNLTGGNGVLAGTSGQTPGTVAGANINGYTLKNITFTSRDEVRDGADLVVTPGATGNAITNTTLGSGITVEAGSTLELRGDTVFTTQITNNGTLSLAESAAVDIGAIAYTKNTDYGEGLSERLHTYRLFTTTSTGHFATGTTFGSSNVMINGALLSKYNSSKLTVNSDYTNAANGIIVLEFNGVETPHWDPAWELEQKKSPWLGHLILEGEGRLDNGNYMFYDNNADSATVGKYRYNELLSEGTQSQVNPNAVSLVLSHHIADAIGKVFAAGNGKLKDVSDPTGEIWVYDTGTAFQTKVAGYVNGDTIHFNEEKTGIVDCTDSRRIPASSLVTHLVLDDTAAGTDTVNTNLVVGGSVYTNSTGNSGSYVSVMDERLHITKLIAGNVFGDLHGDTHVFVHKGTVDTLVAGSCNGNVRDIHLTVDGGNVGSIIASTQGAAGTWNNTLGDVYAHLLGGTIGTFTNDDNVAGNITVELSSKVEGMTSINAKVTAEAFNNNKRATLKLINENEGGAVFNMNGVVINGFDVINIGTDGLVSFDARNFMNAQTTATSTPHVVELTGTGRVIMGNDKEEQSTRAQGVYKLVVNSGIVLDLETCFIHEQNQTGTYPTIVIRNGATFDMSDRPVHSGGGIGIRLEIAGHGVDGLGALYKAGTTQNKNHLTNLPYIDIKGNTSFGGTENFNCDHTSYGIAGYVNMYDSGLNHTLTKQGSSMWVLQRMTFTGGTLNITDTSTVQLKMSSSSSPLMPGNAARYESSSTDVVVDPDACLHIDNEPYKSDNVNTFSMRSLSGNGTVLLDNSYLVLYTDEEVTDFYSEFKDSKQKFWNSAGYTYAVFGGTITDADATGGNMVIKAGSGRQFLSGDTSTYDGTTRMQDGILYLMGTSYGSMVKGTTTVSGGVLGTSHLEWNGGTVTLGHGVRIFNNGQALTGASDDVEHGVSNMIIRVNGMTTTSDTTSVQVSHDSLQHNNKTYYKVDTTGVEKLLANGVYSDGTVYHSGDTVIPGKELYVTNAPDSTVYVNATYLMVQGETLVDNSGNVYHKVDTTGVKTLLAHGKYSDLTDYRPGDAVNPDKELYVTNAKNSMVYGWLEEPRYDDATFSGQLLDAAKGNQGRLVKTGLGTLTIDQYNSYTGGTSVEAGTLNVKGWGLLGGTNSAAVTQTAGASLMLSYDGSYGDDECFFINTDMHLVGKGDQRWKQETETAVGLKDGYTAALISNVGNDFNTATRFTLAGTLQGEGNLLHMGAGTLYIDGWTYEEVDGVPTYVHDTNAGPNTYAGGTTVINGRVYVRKDAGLGATAAGMEANLVTLAGTEIHFEDSRVTLAATKTDDYDGNDIRGSVFIGTADGTIRSTGAMQDGGTMQQITNDVDVKPSVLKIKGNGYWAEKTKVDQDGSLIFQGAAASNTVANSVGGPTKAGYLEGSGALVLDNHDAGALSVEFDNIGTTTDGFSGNIYVQGDNATLTIDDGDYDATRSTKQDDGNITISGTDVTMLAEKSGITITANSKLSLASTNDAWQEGAVADTANGGAATIKAQSIVITEKGTLEVSSSLAQLYKIPADPTVAPRSGDASNLNTLKAASSVKLAEVSSMKATGGEENLPAPVLSGGDLNFVYENGFREDEYKRGYTPDMALNKVAAGVVSTSADIQDGTLRLAANSTLRMDKAHIDLNHTSVNLQHVTNDKINLDLDFDDDVTWKDEYSSQVVLFTNVAALYISSELIYGSPATKYEPDGSNTIYVFKATDYFQNCWQITDNSLLVYDTGAGVIYIDDVIPEPATGALGVLALAAAAARRRRKK